MRYDRLIKVVFSLAASALLLTVACTNKPERAVQRLETAVPETTLQADSSSSIQAIERADIEDTRPVGTGKRLSERESLSTNLRFLLDPAFFEETSAIESIAAEGDIGYVPVLLDAMNSPNAFIWVHAIVQALETLTGQDFDYDWHKWVNWYTRKGIRPVAGYVTWKGAYLGLIDPKFKDYFYEGVKHRIPTDFRRCGW